MKSLPKAVFFDRDGTLNVDTGYVHDSENLIWMPGALEIVSDLTAAGWLVFVVTNQSGVARGYYTEEEVVKLHEWMNKKFAENGGHVTEFFYCPHLPEAKIAKYNIVCECRKPGPQMILKALEYYNIHKNRAFLFGDGKRDIEAAERAGIPGFLFHGGNIREFVHNNLPRTKD